MNKSHEHRFDFPEDNEKLSKQECAAILQKALALSSKFFKVSELAKAAGFKRQTLGDYLYARHKPPKDKWMILRELLVGKHMDIETTIVSKEAAELSLARKKAERLKALIFLMMDDLEFFRDSTPQTRKILNQIIPGAEVGYLTGLFSALYDEDQLKIWLTFSQLNTEGKND